MFFYEWFCVYYNKYLYLHKNKKKRVEIYISLFKI